MSKPNTKASVLKSTQYKVDAKGCWNVVGRKPNMKQGYFLVRADGKRYYLHRLFYEAIHGEIWEGNLVRHTCDNPMCVNPDHLFEGTYLDNVNDMQERGRGIKLSEDKLTCRKGHDLTVPGSIELVRRKGRNDSQQCVACRKDRELLYVRRKGC